MRVHRHMELDSPLPLQFNIRSEVVVTLSHSPHCNSARIRCNRISSPEQRLVFCTRRTSPGKLGEC